MRGLGRGEKQALKESRSTPKEEPARVDLKKRGERPITTSEGLVYGDRRKGREIEITFLLK